MVTDGTGWPFTQSTGSLSQSNALNEWKEYRDSVPYLQLHFVAISSISSKASSASMVAAASTTAKK